MTAITITDLSNAKLDVDHIAAIANSAVLTATDRFGVSKKTLAGVLAAIPDSGVTGFDTLAALSADLMYPSRTVAFVLNDATAENNSTYRKTGASGAGAWVKSLADPVNQIIQMGALLRNQGANYPLRPMVRDGITSAASMVWNNLILDVRVWGAKPGFYYKLAYQQNEAVIGNVDFGWIIYEFAAATFATASVAVLIHDHVDSAQNIVRASGIQSLSFALAARPDMWIDITLDAAKLPAAGIHVTSINSAVAAWSWIIDPSCYVMTAAINAAAGGDIATAISNNNAMRNALLVNQGVNYPLRPMVRDGITSAASAAWNNLILDVRVWGADKGEYYQIAYMQNEALLDGQAAFDWVINAFSDDTFSTASVSIPLISYLLAYGPQQQLSRTGGVQTIRLYPIGRPGMRFDITIDASKLPAAGTTINSLDVNTRAAWSWIIDPSCYELTLPAPTGFAQIHYSTTAAGAVTAAWSSGDYLYRLRFGPNGFNSLPNIIGIDKAPAGDQSTAAWVQVNTSTTDWLPPMVVQAAANGDAGSQIFTGGNHGSSGGASGINTARNTLYMLQIDGKPLTLGNSSGQCDKITAVIVNELMAYNTTSLARYVLRQSFVVDIYAGCVEVKAEVKALEAINVKTDYGPQMVTSGFNATELMLGGATETREAYDSTITSGPKSTNSGAWAVVMQDSANGQQVSWMDRIYGIGDGRHVDATEPLIRGSGSVSTKLYHAAIYSAAMVPFAAGATYKWRGGYAWQAPGLLPGFDSSIAFRKGGEACIACVVSASDYAVLP